MSDFPETLRRAMDPVLVAAPGAGVCLALSGGLDSTVLLHALAGLAPAGLRAIHVNHQLHPDAGEWALHCQRLCGMLGIVLTVRTVRVETGTGEGLEAAARRARYRALSESLQPGEWLLTAHHQDDQAETLLLNLMRGSGVAGLAGIPRKGPLGAAQVFRPLLDVPRAALQAYATEQGLAWIEDPANSDIRMDRNFLRHEILPALESRWPGIRANIGRSARLAAESAALIEDLAAQDARRVLRKGRLSLTALRPLSEARQRNLLRHLCRRELGSVPTEINLREGLGQLLTAGEDRNPVLTWAGGEIRRYRDALYLLHPLCPPPAPDRSFDLQVGHGAKLDLGAGAGELRLMRARGHGLSAARLGAVLTVRFRAGGEHIRLPGETHHRELKKLLQDRGVVPWMRDRIPLLWVGGDLAAVGGLWVAAEFAAGSDEPGFRPRWTRHPSLE